MNFDVFIISVNLASSTWFPRIEICFATKKPEGTGNDDLFDDSLGFSHPRILVHPMNAETFEQSVAFELQAIGRVRRWGQPRNEAADEFQS